MHGSNSPWDAAGESSSPGQGGDPTAADVPAGATLPTLPVISSPYPRLQGQFTPPPRPPVGERAEPPSARRGPMIVAVGSGIVLVVLLTAVIAGFIASHGGSTTAPLKGSSTAGTAPANMTATMAAMGGTATTGVNTPAPAPTSIATPTGPTQQQGALSEASFAHVAAPQGIAVDDNGNIYVTSLGQVIKYNPHGTVAASVPAQATGTLSFDANGMLWDLFPDGTLYALNTSLQSQGQYALGSLITGSQLVYDVTTRQNEPVPFDARSAQFGDISFYQSDAFISGLDASATHPFILRVHLNAASQPDAARLIAFGTATSALPDHVPPGLAVNQIGIIATTMPTTPFSASGATISRLVAFSALFPDDSTAGPPQAQWQIALSSTGMAADTNANFYVATGDVGTGLCAQAPGVILEVAADFSTYSCYTHTSATNVVTRHVAVDDSGDIFDTVIDPAGDGLSNYSKDGVFTWKAP